MSGLIADLRQRYSRWKLREVERAHGRVIRIPKLWRSGEATARGPKTDGRDLIPLLANPKTRDAALENALGRRASYWLSYNNAKAVLRGNLELFSRLLKGDFPITIKEAILDILI